MNIEKPRAFIDIKVIEAKRAELTELKKIKIAQFVTAMKNYIMKARALKG